LKARTGKADALYFSKMEVKTVSSSSGNNETTGHSK